MSDFIEKTKIFIKEYSNKFFHLKSLFSRKKRLTFNSMEIRNEFIQNILHKMNEKSELI